MDTLLGLAAIVVPITALVLVPWFIDRVHEIREVSAHRQIVVTDAIHRELGPVVAPVVRKRPWGPWQLQIAVPFDRPGLVESVLRIARRALESLTSTPFEIVLVPRAEAGHARR